MYVYKVNTHQEKPLLTPHFSQDRKTNSDALHSRLHKEPHSTCAVCVQLLSLRPHIHSLDGYWQPTTDWSIINTVVTKQTGCLPSETWNSQWSNKASFVTAWNYNWQVGQPPLALLNMHFPAFGIPRSPMPSIHSIINKHSSSTSLRPRLCCSCTGAATVNHEARPLPQEAPIRER